MGRVTILRLLSLCSVLKSNHWSSFEDPAPVFHLQVLDLQMSFRDLTTRQGARIVSPGFSTKPHDPLQRKNKNNTLDSKRHPASSPYQIVISDYQQSFGENWLLQWNYTVSWRHFKFCGWLFRLRWWISTEKENCYSQLAHLISSYPICTS